MKSDAIPHKELILLGNWTQKKLHSLLNESSGIDDTCQRIEFLSRHFLGTPYQESTLIGNTNTPEIFVINLEAVDCFTLLDHVESMRLSASFDEFKENLKKLRYRQGKISFENRNHFLTDWRESNSDLIADVTGMIGGNKTIEVRKMLNLKEDGSYFLPGIHPKERMIHYIPLNAIDDSIISKLRTGDYIAIYSEKHGLDVSHVGIFINEGNKTYLRHASSLKEYRKVVDQDFKDYIHEKPGILVSRSRK